jgi:hypothetical protein
VGFESGARGPTRQKSAVAEINSKWARPHFFIIAKKSTSKHRNNTTADIVLTTLQIK